MYAMLRYLARILVRLRWVTIACWAVVALASVHYARHVQEVLNTRGGSHRLTEADQAERLLREGFSHPLSEFFAVTLQGPDSLTEPAGRAVADSIIAALERESFVRGVVSYYSTGDSTFLSRDRHTTFLLAALRAPSPDSVGALVEPARAAVHRGLAAAPGGSRYSALVTGRSPLDHDVRRVTAEDSVRGELYSLPLTLIILVFAFGALMAATLPLLVGFLAITISLAIISLVARVMPMSIFVLNMTTMIGLGVGIDYSLLIVTRFREELNRGLSRRDAAVRTLQTAGAAVVTSGVTVLVGFAALITTPLVETRSVGVGGLIVVLVAVLLSVTLLPAILALLGRHIDFPRAVAKRLAWYHAPMIWEKWARSLSRHPLRALTLGGTAIAIMTAPLFWIRIGLPSHNWWPQGTESGAGAEVLSGMGVAGLIQPVRVMVQFPSGQRAVSAAHLRALMALSDSLRSDPRIGQVRSIVDLRANRSLLGYSVLYSDLAAAREQFPDFLDAYLSRDASATLLDLVPADTTSLTSSMDLVRRARRVARDVRGLSDATILVGGYAAANVDLQQDLLARFPVMVLLILLTTGVMLALAFKSVLVPIKAVVMNTLSVSATFGITVLVFQHGWGSRLFGLGGPTSAIYVVVPVLVFAVVFGLSMDYEVFLLTRIREAFDKTGRNSQATMEGLSATASVITSAALIMIVVFGVFAFARVLAMQFLGFGLAMAVLLDATIVRMVLVPAFMHLAGRWNWWPGVRGR